MPGWPVRKNGEARTLKPAPLLGQHSAEALKDWLGLSDAQVEALRTDKAI
jgi:crotonobetainyl-CoA:carnitine CoA-transferase CaiB-like acyl-CoA transferase